MQGGTTPQIGGKMADGAIYAGISPDTHEPMYTTSARVVDHYNWNRGAEYCRALKINGHVGWRLPTKDELSVLYNNREAIGGFDTSGAESVGWYWSFSEEGGDLVWGQRFSDGEQYYNIKTYVSSVRCVR
jgi:Protein of unknown function (DUF1566)